MDNSTEKKIIAIANELKSRNLVDPNRNIKPSKQILGGFKASVFTSNTISYDPNLYGLDDNIIRFCILHEEGHLKQRQYGKTLIILLIGLGFAPLFFCILSRIGDGILLISLLSGLFVFLFSFRIMEKPLHRDEYGSDEFASKILHEKYGIKKPSEILKNTLNSMPSRVDSSKFLDRLFILFFEYHPSIEQRVRNIVESVDEK